MGIWYRSGVIGTGMILELTQFTKITQVATKGSDGHRSAGWDKR